MFLFVCFCFFAVFFVIAKIIVNVSEKSSLICIKFYDLNVDLIKYYNNNNAKKKNNMRKKKRKTKQKRLVRAKSDKSQCSLYP